MFVCVWNVYQYEYVYVYIIYLSRITMVVLRMYVYIYMYIYIYIHIYAHGYMYINVYIYTLYICKHTAMIGPGAMTISWCRYEEKPRVSNRKKSKRPGLGNIALKVANWSMDILKASFVRLNIWYIK